MIRNAIRTAVDRCFPEGRLVQGSRQTARGHRNCGYKRMSRNALERGACWQGTPRSGLVVSTIGIESIRFLPHTLSRSQHNSHEHLQMWDYAGYKGVVFFMITCAVVQY